MSCLGRARVVWVMLGSSSGDLGHAWVMLESCVGGLDYAWIVQVSGVRLELSTSAIW